jgi:hypothetical protein
MSKNTAKIRNGLIALTAKENEILSGTVVDINTDDATMSVLVTNYKDPIQGVRLNAVEQNNKGWLIYPELNSNVIIGSVDGAGEYCLIRASNITKAVITIGDQTLTMDGNKYGIVNGGESLGKIMADLLQEILNITVTTSTGPSGTPVNTTAISKIKDRLNNFLTS